MIGNREAVPSVWRAPLAGFAAILVAIGLSRFAYTALMPALVGARWFGPPAAAWLGAANLAGYLAGALLAASLSGRFGTRALLRTMLVTATAAFFACAFPLPLPWFLTWRLLSGISGGVVMVLAPPAILTRVPEAQHGRVGGALYIGVGVGIVLSATLVPALLRFGLTRAWEGLGGVALLLSIVAWNGWPAGLRAGAVAPSPAPAPPPPIRRALAELTLAYALNAVGLVAHIVFLVDFVARGLGKGIATGSAYWLLFGLGAVAGPMLTGGIADRIGFGRALKLAFLAEAVAVGLLAVTAGTGALVISCLVVGAFVPGIVPLVLGRVHELVPDAGERRAAWSRCTMAFAAGLAAGAYALSLLFALSGGAYRPLFAAGASALILAFAIDLASPARRLRPSHAGSGPG